MTEFPVDAVRAEFPALALEDEGRPRVYLDNPAGTQIPRRVIETVSKTFVEASSNLGGHFASSRASDEAVHDARVAMADFLGAPSEREIVFGPSMTSLTFRMALALGARFQPGDEIVVTRMDHEGNVSPWLQIAEDRGLEVKWLPFDRDTWQIEPGDLEAVLSEKTRLLALNHASNLTGSINHIQPLIAKAREAGALVYVDSVQFAPHGLIDVAALGCDFLVCSSYKFFGPHMGVLWGRYDLLEDLRAYRVRCASAAPPSKFEWGTPQTELLAGVNAAVDYFAWLGKRIGAGGTRREQISAAYRGFGAYESQLTARLVEGLGEIEGVSIQGITNPNRLAERVPTVSFVHREHSPPTIAKALGDEGIFVWSGHNYALELARFLGLDERAGALRIGLAHYNTLAEVEQTLSSLRRVLA